MPTEEVDARRPARSEGARAAAASGAVALLACVGVLLATTAETYWINDCGNKALMAERLWETGYRELAFDRPSADVDPHGRAFPIAAPFAVEQAGDFVSSYPPAYAALAAPFAALFGPAGLRVPAALGVAAAAALMSAWLAPVLGFAWAIAAGLVLALATPLFFYGVTLWEHSLTVALCLGACALATRAAPARLFAAGWLIASAVWLREEIALMGVALALAVLVVDRKPVAPLWLLAGASIPAAGLLSLNEVLYGSPLGLHFAANAGFGAEASGLPASAAVGGVRVLGGVMGGYGRGNVEAALLGVAALAAPLSGWALGRSRRLAAAGVVLATAVGLAAWGLGFGRTLAAARPLEEMVRYNGLLVQLPLWCLVGLGAEALLRDDGLARIRVGVLAGLGFLALALAAGSLTGSGYGVQAGFGAHWGPRVLLPAFPAVVALGVVAVRGGRTHGPRAMELPVRVAFALLVAAGLASSVQSVRMLAAQKADAHRFEGTLRQLPLRYVLTTHPMLGQHLAGLWHAKPLLLARDEDSLANAIAGLRRGGAREFAFVVPAGGPLLSWLDGLACRLVESHRGPWLHYFDLDVQRCAFSGRGAIPGRGPRARSR